MSTWRLPSPWTVLGQSLTFDVLHRLDLVDSSCKVVIKADVCDICPLVAHREAKTGPRIYHTVTHEGGVHHAACTIFGCDSWQLLEFLTRANKNTVSIFNCSLIFNVAKRISLLGFDLVPESWMFVTVFVAYAKFGMAAL
jgi:hypothetical protein